MEVEHHRRLCRRAAPRGHVRREFVRLEQIRGSGGTVGPSGLSNTDMLSWAQRNGIRGLRNVITRNRLSSYKLKPGESVIINIQPASEGSGTHWVLLLRDANGAFTYLDPLGLGYYPPTEVTKATKGSPVIRTNQRFQGITSKMCGVICCYFLEKLQQGSSFSSVCHRFRPQVGTSSNDQWLAQWWAQTN